jgi:CBS domain-containing protein
METLGSFIQGQELATVSPSTSVLDAARTMTDRAIGAVPVVDGDRLAGIFTERDVMTRVVARELDASVTTVGSLMSTELIIADVGEGREEAMARLQRAHVRHLLVLEHGRLAGIVSIRDLLDHELADKDETLALLNAYVHDVPADLTRKRP